MTDDHTGNISDGNGASIDSTVKDTAEHVTILDKIYNKISNVPKKTRHNLIAFGTMVAVFGLMGYGYRIGKGQTLDRLNDLQNDTVITKPYRVFNENSVVSPKPAKYHFMRMKEGQQFWYRNKIVTLVDRAKTEEKGYMDIFLVGKELIDVPTSALDDTISIHETFQKYRRE